MKRPNYTHFVTWIAWFDGAGCDDAGNADGLDEIRLYETTRMVASLFDVSTERVANDIATERRREGFTVGHRLGNRDDLRARERMRAAMDEARLSRDGDAVRRSARRRGGAP